MQVGAASETYIKKLSQGPLAGDEGLKAVINQHREVFEFFKV